MKLISTITTGRLKRFCAFRSQTQWNTLKVIFINLQGSKINHSPVDRGRIVHAVVRMHFLVGEDGRAVTILQRSKINHTIFNTISCQDQRSKSNSHLMPDQILPHESDGETGCSQILLRSTEDDTVLESLLIECDTRQMPTRGVV